MTLVANAATETGLPADPPATGPLARYEFVSPQMGTLFRIVLYAPSASAGKTASSAAFARVTDLNRIMSDYDPNSELMHLSERPPRTPIAVSAELFDILQESQRLAERSGGAFDVTQGPAVRLWREARRTRRLPAKAERAAAMRASGYKNLRLNAAIRTVALLVPGMQLDLGGIAKGFAADEALAVLARHGLPCAMVAASGDLALGDAPPGTAGWKIELAPFGPSAGKPWVIVAANVGVSTSGDTEQFVEIDGVRYSHIVNPATVLGLADRVAVTIIAPRAALSDGLATACSVLADGRAESITGCIGDSARAIVFRRNESGALQRQVYGSSPPGLRTSL